MADINRDPARQSRLEDPPGSGGTRADSADGVDRDLISHVELLFFAYRDFTADPDAVLAEYGFGRAHHRVLHFVNRTPGLRVAHLLDILKITKQSLARVLKQLIGDGFITQRAGAEDRRERLLFVTGKGARLADKLISLQVKRIEAALGKTSRETEAASRQFLLAMISESDRAHVEALVAQPSARKPDGKAGG